MTAPGLTRPETPRPGEGAPPGHPALRGPVVAGSECSPRDRSRPSRSAEGRKPSR
jgi:hypothetical protein